MNVPARVLVFACALTAVLIGAEWPGTGAQAPRTAAQPLTVISRDGRRTIDVSVVNGQEMVSLDDLASTLNLTVREDALAGGISVATSGKTLVLSLSQGLASAGGRMVTLPAAPVKSGRSWLVPVDVIGRALALVVDGRLELRRASRLVLVGDVRVPRVTVRYEPPEAASARVTLDIAPATDHRVEQDGQRLLVRFEADALDAALGTPVKGDLLAGAQIVSGSPAIALELGPRFASYRASDQPGDAGATRLVIDLLAAGAPPPTPTAPAPETPVVPAPAPEAPSAIFEQPGSTIRTVVIDPGHGGEELGARGPGGNLEKDVTLAIARQLKWTIEGRLGLRVLLTREGDETVVLDQRAAIANNNKADLFISLHANASVRNSVAGAEVFYLSLGEYGLEAQRALAGESEQLPAVGGGSRAIDVLLWEMAQARHIEESSAFATIIEQQLRARIPMSPRALQQAPFRVLVGANMPAVLVEMGFISNPAEEGKLVSPPHQTLIVQALYDSLVRFRGYLDTNRRGVLPTTTPAPPGGAP